ncbi:MBOAT, membrane-bound O-acyltransferase family [Singulisphaera sp. GP187]|uniref:MBOAT family O-acyltransferase n=1 Tax=Singulisphaera sp. GP187 TaxID=1882752 RepID=UPI000927622A|nr:MBOAT family O-acyltransferase [Singulisphaera sp. GP187]SIO65055.1 MBOAT, membrane-bound O-acyltransferase family [Singulisphaera sp. GP187]
MKNVGWLFLAILVAYGFAMVAPLPRYRLRGWVGAFIGWCFVPIILVCPWLIPSANLGLRAASAFASGDITFKLVDYLRHWDKVDRRIVLREYYRFLIPFPILSAVYPDHKRRLLRPECPWPQVLRLFGGIIGFTVALLAVRALSGIALVRSCFALNHTVMLLTFVLAIESLSRALGALERLAGFDTTPIIRNAYLSRTVSEFWRRYNCRIHDWLYRNVFQATGGRRTPVRSLLLVFLVSGLFHEVMFALATSRLTGYQLAFFTIQGPAALASGWLERLARRGGIAGQIMAHGATILFVAVTSVLFFDGVSKIFPFLYVSQSPLL